MAALADPRPPARIKDSALLRDLHFEWRECVLCGDVSPLSLHHVCKHPRDDVRGNLVMVCGDGVRGCHGRITANDQETLELLGRYIKAERPDIIEHIRWRFGETADEWLRVHLVLDS